LGAQNFFSVGGVFEPAGGGGWGGGGGAPFPGGAVAGGGRGGAGKQKKNKKMEMEKPKLKTTVKKKKKENRKQKNRYQKGGQGGARGEKGGENRPGALGKRESGVGGGRAIKRSVSGAGVPRSGPPRERGPGDSSEGGFSRAPASMGGGGRGPRGGKGKPGGKGKNDCGGEGAPPGAWTAGAIAPPRRHTKNARCPRKLNFFWRVGKRGGRKAPGVTGGGPFQTGGFLGPPAGRGGPRANRGGPQGGKILRFWGPPGGQGVCVGLLGRGAAGGVGGGRNQSVLHGNLSPGGGGGGGGAWGRTLPNGGNQGPGPPGGAGWVWGRSFRWGGTSGGGGGEGRSHGGKTCLF